MHSSLSYMLSYPKDEAAVGFIWCCLIFPTQLWENSHLFWFIGKQKTLAFIFVLQPTSQNCYLCD